MWRASSQSFGLKPGGDEGSWYQQSHFSADHARRRIAGSITISGPAGEQRFEHADDVLVGLNGREPKLDVSAPLVFVGYGVEDERLGSTITAAST